MFLYGASGARHGIVPMTSRSGSTTSRCDDNAEMYGCMPAFDRFGGNLDLYRTGKWFGTEAPCMSESAAQLGSERTDSEYGEQRASEV